ARRSLRDLILTMRSQRPLEVEPQPAICRSHCFLRKLKTITMRSPIRFQRRRSASRHSRSRLGAVTVELALCIPFLVTIAFGMVECCNLIYLRTRMYTAAY